MERALDLCSLPYRVQPAPSMQAESAQAELLCINPQVQVATLQLDDGSVLTESAAVLIQRGVGVARACVSRHD